MFNACRAGAMKITTEVLDSEHGQNQASTIPEIRALLCFGASAGAITFDCTGYSPSITFEICLRSVYHGRMLIFPVGGVIYLVLRSEMNDDGI